MAISHRKKPMLLSCLRAVKRIGNAGSHGFQDVEIADVLKIAVYLEHALMRLYGTPELVQQFFAINQAKGRKSKPATT